jgi:2-methylisocitrate lyase-like PEP mutase family enzyme
MKTLEFRRLHESGCFVIPNPWDAGSARQLERLGFKALATTSSGIAWSLGMRDNHVPIDLALKRIEEICAAVEIPVNADFEGGFAVEPAAVAANVRRALATGIAGISIEDSTGDPAQPLYEFELAVERVRAAASAVSGTGVLLTARSEGFIVGRPDLDETLKRLRAFADAGAECLYAPGIRDHSQIRAVVEAVSPRPVNALVGAGFATVAQLEAIGVRRISVGGALARSAWTGLLHTAPVKATNG